MKRLQRAAVLVALVEAMNENNSWCGGIHIQKACYFLQELLTVPLGFKFVLYKHGPYSFDLNNELSALRADEFLDLYVRDAQYGPCYRLGDLSEKLEQNFRKTIRRFGKQVNFVAYKLGDKGVSELERLATALYVRMSETKELSAEKAAEQLTKHKPHMGKPLAIQAVTEVDEWMTSDYPKLLGTMASHWQGEKVGRD